MPRKVRAPSLETRTARLKLPPRRKPYAFTTIAPGLALAYRKNKGVGAWVVRCADGHGGNWTKTLTAVPDDHEDADGRNVLNFFQASDAARALARGPDGSDLDRPLAWGEAVDAYEADLTTRGGRLINAQLLRRILPPALLSKPVGLLTTNELRRWRDGLLARGLSPASVTRYCKCACASLSLAATRDARIANRSAWMVGLGSLPGSRRARNQVLTDDMVRSIVTACYARDPGFGLFIELLALTGARPIQARRLLVRDVQAARVMMPRSAKGSGVKKIDRRPLPLPPSIVAKLAALAGARAPDEPLFARVEAWDVSRRWAEALTTAKLPKATPYSLRHSSITRSLLRGVPVRVCADVHDTSVAMIEQTYGSLIADHSDALLRAAQLDLTPTPAAADKVVHMRRKG